MPKKKITEEVVEEPVEEKIEKIPLLTVTFPNDGHNQIVETINRIIERLNG